MSHTTQEMLRLTTGTEPSKINRKKYMMSFVCRYIFFRQRQHYVIITLKGLSTCWVLICKVYMLSMRTAFLTVYGRFV